MENGKTTRWKAMVCSHGLMAEGTKVNTLMIRKKAKVHSSGKREFKLMNIGLMEENTRVIGRMESSMVSEYTRQLLGKQRRENGKKEKESLG